MKDRLLSPESNSSSIFRYNRDMPNLRRRIERALEDETLKIQHEVFEKCAISVLRNLYPNIESVSGGTDGGLDGRFIHDGRVIGILVTSSRQPEGSRANLRKNLKSVSANYPDIDTIVFASLANVSMRLRQQLENIALKSGFILAEVFGREWFIDQFYNHPEWRTSVLGIPDDPSCFSLAPRGWDQNFAEAHTIGREQIFDHISNSRYDVLLAGLPGIGKTHIAGCLSGAVFLNSHADRQGLVDGLLSLRPSYVVIDDAGLKTDKIQLIREIRELEDFDFRIVATCWPQQQSGVAGELNQPTVIEVDRLIPSEIGEIVRAKGITRKAVIARILEQADGRPGWAMNLASLITEQQDLRAAWSGAGLQAAVESSMRKLGLDQRARTVLGTLALIGDLDERDFSRLSNLLGIPRLEITEILESIATAGLIDVSLRRTYDVIITANQPMNLFSTQPGLMRTSLAGTVYFSRKSQPASLDEVKRAFPEKIGAILQSQCDTHHIEAERVSLPREAEIQAWSVEARNASLLQSYSAVGLRQSEFCANAVLSRVEHCLENGNSAEALEIAKEFAAAVGVMHWSEGSPVIRDLLAILHLLECSSVDNQPVITAVSSSLKSTLPGDPPSSRKIIDFLKCLDRTTVPKTLEPSLVKLTAQIAVPAIEISYLDPEDPSQIVLTNGAWAQETLREIGDLLLNLVSAKWQDLPPRSQCQLVDLLGKWAHLAHYRQTFTVSNEQRKAAECVASSLATAMSKSTSNPGVIAQFNDAAEPLGFQLVEPDLLFSALTEDLDFALDVETALQQQDDLISKALKPYLRQDPSVLMTWLNDHADSFLLARSGRGIQGVFWSLASHAIDHLAWAEAAHAFGYAWESMPLVAELVKRDSVSISDLENFGRSHGGFQVLLQTIIEHSANPVTVKWCLDRASAIHIKSLNRATIWRSNALTRKALFTHPDADIRGFCAAVWSASPSLDVQDDCWRKAILNYGFWEKECADSFYDVALGNIFLAEVELFTQLFSFHLNASPQNYVIDLRPWAYAMDSATPELRSQVWCHIANAPNACDAFWAVAGDDIAWAKSEISAPHFDLTASNLLRAYELTSDLSYDLVDLAEVMRPLRPDPFELVGSIESGVFTGPESEVLKQRLHTLHRLSASEDPYLSEIGRAGIARYEPRLSRVRKREREAEVRGQLA